MNRTRFSDPAEACQPWQDDEDELRAQRTELKRGFIPRTFVDEVYDEDGTAKTVTYAYYAPRGMLGSEVAEYAKKQFPYTYCQHSYDCCGNWYCYGPDRPRIGRVRKEDRTTSWLVRVRWAMNI